MTLVVGYSPTTGEVNYEDFPNPDSAITGAGFVDTGGRTAPVPSRGYAGGAIIYGGVVSPDGASILPNAPAPDASVIAQMSASVARTPPPSQAGIAYLKAWAAQHPGATIYAVHQ